MSIINISPETGLKPKTKFFEELGEDCINVDGCIELCRRIDTPEAKAIYHAFRKHLAHLRSSMHGTKPEKIREEAFFAALKEMGVTVNMKTLKGTMS